MRHSGRYIKWHNAYITYAHSSRLLCAFIGLSYSYTKLWGHRNRWYIFKWTEWDGALTTFNPLSPSLFPARPPSPGGVHHIANAFLRSSAAGEHHVAKSKTPIRLNSFSLLVTFRSFKSLEELRNIIHKSLGKSIPWIPPQRRDNEIIMCTFYLASF